ncbi:hypothetical protein BDV96DRAFT_600628 [Lophiotrema nucula]|uniref:Uncharacterized protein n=1 Tax=Lophiotrema nucula TaxID=690887 RepID=A0A6A5Z6M4_9PLEO|nr:hypothetical protein BDV96DRAFT_600628 [Lophiotrema nucula]
MPPQPSPYFTTILNPSNAPSPTTTNTNTSRQPFTPAQRSLQARNRPFHPSPKIDAEAESYEQRQRKNLAVEILENTELLIWFSSARNESISATRQHYQNVLMGIEDEEVTWREEWEVPVEERVKGAEGTKSVEGSPRHGKSKEKERERDKGKKRVSSA